MHKQTIITNKNTVIMKTEESKKFFLQEKRYARSLVQRGGRHAVEAASVA